jgi:regulatory protein
VKLSRVEHGSNDTVQLFLDDEADPRLEVPLDVFIEADLRIGATLTEATLDALRVAAELSRVREAALSLLAHRPRAREELRRRLRRKDFSEPVIDSVIAWLEERSYLDDDAFAEAFVRDRLRLRPRGRFGLHQELCAKGVAPEVAERAIARVLDEENLDELGLARGAAEAWARKNPTAVEGFRDGNREARVRARRKLYGHLARRGFSGDAARAALEHVFTDADGSGQCDD